MLAETRLHTLPAWQVYSGMGGRIQRNIQVDIHENEIWDR